MGQADFAWSWKSAAADESGVADGVVWCAEWTVAYEGVSADNKPATL